MSTALLIIFLCFALFTLWDILLDVLNLKHIERESRSLPDCLASEIDAQGLERINSYTGEKLRFEIIRKSYRALLLLVFVFLGAINIYNYFIFSIRLNYYFNAIAYIYGLCLLSSILEIPFDLYSTFRIEKKYNFNTMNIRLWVVDFVKSQLMLLILLSLVLCAALFIMRYVYNWWLLLWTALLLFSLFMMYVSPYLIEPLFNKFTPVDDSLLTEGIAALLGRAGIKLKRVMKIDASKRTRHTNAYFSGIGKVKRIVLYDTLLEKLNYEEILAVLAHEAGHWKKKHLLKRMILIEAVLLIFCSLAWQLINSDFVICVFNITVSSANALETYLPCVLFMLYFLSSLALYPFLPLMNHLSRCDEKEADAYSCTLTGGNQALVSALVKLAKDNLSNLNPQKLYSVFHYSHPPICERLEWINRLKP